MTEFAVSKAYDQFELALLLHILHSLIQSSFVTQCLDTFKLCQPFTSSLPRLFLSLIHQEVARRVVTDLEACHLVRGC